MLDALAILYTLFSYMKEFKMPKKGSLIFLKVLKMKITKAPL